MLFICNNLTGHYWAHLIPGADISLFYMDLQIMGKEARKNAARLPGNVHLIQGVPGEILERDSGLTMIVENSETGSCQSQSFDMVILSVGMIPAPETADIAGLLDLTPNKWGFFNTPQAGMGPDIYVAGCAKGSKNITTAIQEGKIAGAKIIKDLGLKKNPKMDIAVMGKGAQAVLIAKTLEENGYPALFFADGPGPAPGVKDLSQARIFSIEGSLGHFFISYDLKGKKNRLTCGAIIAAAQAESRSNTSHFPSAMDLGTFIRMINKKEPSSSLPVPDKILILLDYFGPESKDQAGQALAAALTAQSQGCQVDILMNHIRVHGPTGQQVYDQAKKAGIGFFRYKRQTDLNIRPKGRGVKFIINESTLPGIKIELYAQTLVVPDTRCASQDFPELADLLKLVLDEENFLQEANIRHRP
ncbi:MAG: hypothetical protein HUN05_09405 [Desulfobacter sp.]|nr:MAG: hypothetical protein HUN05_09405 [Desulfobacter sp.]